MASTERHVRITYRLGVSYDYRIKSEAAPEFTRAMSEWLPGTVITVDDEVTAELPVIPCAELWEA